MTQLGAPDGDHPAKELTYIFGSLQYIIYDGPKLVRTLPKGHSFHVLVLLYHATHAYTHHVIETCKGPRDPLGGIERFHERIGQSVLYLPVDLSMRAECMHEK